MSNNQSDKIRELLLRYEADQQEFENHWLWQHLGTTPKQFFQLVQDRIKEQSIDPDTWQEKLAIAKQEVETRTQEQKQQSPCDTRLLSCLRA